MVSLTSLLSGSLDLPRAKASPAKEPGVTCLRGPPAVALANGVPNTPWRGTLLPGRSPGALILQPLGLQVVC